MPLSSKPFRDLCRRAVQKWGAANQLDMAVEEAAEFIVEVQHYKRERDNRAKLVEEIADLEIMLEQVRVILDASANDAGEYGMAGAEIAAAKSAKLERLAGRLGR